MKIILAEGGEDKRTVNVNKIRIHDLWHIAMRIKDEEDQRRVLEVWYLAHDLRSALLEIANGADLTKPIHTK